MLANLRALFGVVVDIVLLRRGPEHLPASPALLAVVIAIYLVVYAVLTVLSPNVPPIWVLPLLMAALIAVLWFRAGLMAAKKRERFTQTTAAYFAATTLFLPILVPLESVLRPYMASQETMREAPGSVVLPAAALGIWVIVVQARIVRSAFEWPTILSFVFILALNFVSVLLLGLLFGTPAPES